uniref:Uncharacterized protein n=1 Tax=Parastrongyloides trichosuri TaxID=131310 RepID=A0A0N4ZUR9_PARTI
MFLIILTIIIGALLLYFINNYRKKNIYNPRGENIYQTATVEATSTLFDKTQLSDLTRSLTDYFDIRPKLPSNTSTAKESDRCFNSNRSELTTTAGSSLPQTQTGTMSPTTTTIKTLEQQQGIGITSKLTPHVHSVTTINGEINESEKNKKNQTKQQLEWSSNENVQLDPASKAAEEYRLLLLKKRNEKNISKLAK